MTSEFNPRVVRLVIGLGNPGKTYEHTYHNAGRLFTFAVAERFGARVKRALIGRFDYAETSEYGLIFPRTFMNESGRALQAALSRFKVKLKETLVVHDDSDLPLGNYKLEFGRGDAGHKGVASIIKVLGKDMWRLRVGVRSAEWEGKKAEDFVLRRISPADEEKLKELFEEIIGSHFQNTYN